MILSAVATGLFACVTVGDGPPSAMHAAIPLASPTPGPAAPAPTTLGLETGRPAAAPHAARADQWQLSFAPYVWAPSTNGDATIFGQPTDLDASLIDSLKDLTSLKGAFQGRVTADRGVFGAYLDINYADVGLESELAPGLTADIDFRLTMVEAVMMHTLIDRPFGDASGLKTLRVRGGGGMRYYSYRLDQSVPDDPTGLAEMSGSKTWIDPLISVEAAVMRQDRGDGFILRADVGGFGAGSELTWQVSAIRRAQINFRRKPLTLEFGYKALSVDYEGDHSDVQILQHGPLIGLVF